MFGGVQCTQILGCVSISADKIAWAYLGATLFGNHTKDPALNDTIAVTGRVLPHRVAIMDLSSSPPALYSELPPSSAPDPTPTANGPPRQQIADALTIDPDADSNEPEATNKRRKRPRQLNGEVPMVKDAVGESVAESFESFLKT